MQSQITIEIRNPSKFNNEITLKATLKKGQTLKFNNRFVCDYF